MRFLAMVSPILRAVVDVGSDPPAFCPRLFHELWRTGGDAN